MHTFLLSARHVNNRFTTRGNVKTIRRLQLNCILYVSEVDERNGAACYSEKKCSLR
jgi:hypothetical protein